MTKRQDMDARSLIATKEDTMRSARRKRWAGGLLGLLAFGTGLLPALAGDSFYGRVTAVKNAEVVVLEYIASGGPTATGPSRSTVPKPGRSDIRLIGIDAPDAGGLAREARQFVANLVLGKNARMRFEYRNRNGEMVSRLLTDDPTIGIKDVGLELVRAGLARRQSDYDYKYGELSAAEREARTAGRGLWAQTEPR
jgi:endonuclease YncB( thermonuclease family)